MPTMAQQDRRKVLKALRNPKYTWRTVKGIAKDTRLTQQRVKAVLARPGKLIIQSEIPNSYGEDLFGLIDHEAAEQDQPASSRWWKFIGVVARACARVGASEGCRLLTGLPIGDLLIALREEWERSNEEDDPEPSIDRIVRAASDDPKVQKKLKKAITDALE